MIILIDNYDSFTWNLVHFIGELGVSCNVIRNDKTTVENILFSSPEAIVLSPGPGTPDDAGFCLSLVRAAGGKIPVLGVCLGHQVIVQAYGGRVVRANSLMHGKCSMIAHYGSALFSHIPDVFKATRYHSLIVDPASMPEGFEITAKTEDGVIMAVENEGEKLYGVQFHPESIATDYGHRLLANFLRIAGIEHREQENRVGGAQ